MLTLQDVREDQRHGIIQGYRMFLLLLISCCSPSALFFMYFTSQYEPSLILSAPLVNKQLNYLKLTKNANIKMHNKALRSPIGCDVIFFLRQWSGDPRRKTPGNVNLLNMRKTKKSG